MAKFEAVAHVTWELPFLLRIPPRAFLTWEPAEGKALLDPRRDVGELSWSRSSSLLPAADLFGDLGPENPHSYPEYDYLLKAKDSNGREFKTARLMMGRHGGFSEPRPYTFANLFLCLRELGDYASEKVRERTVASLNNFIDVYRFATMDTLARALDVSRDCVYTMVSAAELSPEMRDMPPEELLLRVGELQFGHVIGKDRSHTLGLNSFDDLFPGPELPQVFLDDIYHLAESRHELEIFHQLVLSAIRRLKRNEAALAILDAQSAFESFVAVLVVEELKRRNLSPETVEHEMSYPQPLHSLAGRLRELDLIATRSTSGVAFTPFAGSKAHLRWRDDLYKLRNRIVHTGLREVSFESAKRGLVAGLRAADAINDLTSLFSRPMRWSGEAVELPHIRQSSGRLSRLFEA
jgi:hypothetical protein